MAPGKKLINSVDTCVDDMLKGFAFCNPNIALHLKRRVILVKEWESRSQKVALVSGGGSGHEPFCAGYVGRGMLTSIAAGSVFASPPASSILHSIKCVSKTNSDGVLVIIPNYTGDCLNFGLAVERARKNGIKVETVTVGEDCALLELRGNDNPHRRGMCGLVFTFKIGGAMAEEGKSLISVRNEVAQVVRQMATIGVALAACSLPGSPPLFTLAEDEMELGIGVHGEAGANRIKMCSASQAVELMLERLINALELRNGDEVAILINNLGGSSQLEQWIIANEVKVQLGEKNIKVLRMYVGPFMTSLEMFGIQVSLLKINPANKDRWLRYLDEETNAPAWPKPTIPTHSSTETIFSEEDHEEYKEETGLRLTGYEEKLFKQCLIVAARDIIKEEQQLNYLDSGCGDGDCGSTLRRLAEGVLQEIEKKALTFPGKIFHQLANTAETCMGGTSGAIYSLMFISASGLLEESSKGCVRAFEEAWKMGIDGITKYSTARRGDRTLLDALIPAYEAFKNHPKETKGDIVSALQEMVKAAEKGCAETKSMGAKAGRASYVNEALLTDVDAGAYAVLVWLKAVSKTITAHFQ